MEQFSDPVPGMLGQKYLLFRTCAYWSYNSKPAPNDTNCKESRLEGQKETRSLKTPDKFQVHKTIKQVLSYWPGLRTVAAKDEEGSRDENPTNFLLSPDSSAHTWLSKAKTPYQKQWQIPHKGQHRVKLPQTPNVVFVAHEHDSTTVLQSHGCPVTRLLTGPIIWLLFPSSLSLLQELDAWNSFASARESKRHDKDSWIFIFLHLVETSFGECS